ncbi:MAG: SMC family ATPase [Thermoproteales archaeon]|nr:SMC family ATPase [Thermoproteales archaeon]
MIKINSIEVEGFRAFRDKISLDLDRRLIVFAGDIGSGKTSLLMAIEFALFGTTREIKRKILKKEDLINDFCDTAYVVLLLDNEGKKVRIERLLTRGKRTKTKVVYEKGELFDELANEYLSSLLDISLDEFSKQIAVTHFDLQDLIYGSPASRSVTIDRLLGIDVVERIFRSIQLGNIEKYEREFSDKIKNIKYRLSIVNKELISEEEAKSLVIELNKLREEKERLKRMLEELGKEYEDLKDKEKRYRELKDSETRLLSIIDHYKQMLKNMGQIDASYVIYERIRHGLIKALEELFLEKDKDEIANYVLDKGKIGIFLKLCKKKIDIIDNEREKLVKEINELAAEKEYKFRRIRDLERELGRLSLLSEEFESYNERLNELIDKYGDEDDLRRKINELNIEIEKEKARMAEVKCILMLQKRILEQQNNAEVSCPVCGCSNVLKDDIRKLYESYIGKYSVSFEENIEELQRERDKLEEVLREIKLLKEKVVMGSEVKVRFEKLEQSYSDLSNELRELEENIEMLEGKIEKITILLRNINKLVTRAESIQKIEDIRDKVSEYEKKLDRVRGELLSLGFDEKYYRNIYEKYMETKSNIDTIRMKIEMLEEKLSEYRESMFLKKELEKELNSLVLKHAKIIDFKRRLTNIRNIFRFLQIELRKKMLERINRSMNEIFRKIYIFDDYDAIELRLKTTESAPYRRSLYEIYAHRKRDYNWVLVSNRMSDGQKIIVALCLVVALSKLYNHNIGFLILDEPVPNVDNNTRSIVYNVLSKELNIDQIIMATQHIEGFKDIGEGRVFIFRKKEDSIAVEED